MLKKFGIIRGSAIRRKMLEKKSSYHKLLCPQVSPLSFCRYAFLWVNRPVIFCHHLKCKTKKHIKRLSKTVPVRPSISQFSSFHSVVCVFLTHFPFPLVFIQDFFSFYIFLKRILCSQQTLSKLISLSKQLAFQCLH